MEVCLEETFVEALLKFGGLLPLRDLQRDAPRVNPETDAEKVLHTMLQSAENNTKLENHGNTTSLHRWYAEICSLHNIHTDDVQMIAHIDQVKNQH